MLQIAPQITSNPNYSGALQQAQDLLFKGLCNLRLNYFWSGSYPPTFSKLLTLLKIMLMNTINITFITSKILPGFYN